ncbi:MAG: ribonuclease III [Phototrophicaceae bacterium]
MTEKDDIKTYQDLIGVHFMNPEMLKRALTHRSFVNEADEALRDNERLEFLGDAILDLIVADMLFRRFADVSEGELTQLRAALVRTDSLAMLAKDIQLGEYLLMGKGEINSGGRTRVNNLCRGYEALIGGMYLDRGLDAVRDFVLPPLNNLLEYVLENDLHKDARSMLQERSQADLHYTPNYRLKDSNGPDHEREFVVEVIIADVILAEGAGTSKRVAAQSAARVALKIIQENDWSAEILEAVAAWHEQQALEAEVEALLAESIIDDDEDSEEPEMIPVEDELLSESDEV